MWFDIELGLNTNAHNVLYNKNRTSETPSSRILGRDNHWELSKIWGV